MKVYHCAIGANIQMYEDELPEDLPEELYLWWFNNSWVDGVRIGPSIKENSTYQAK